MSEGLTWAEYGDLALRTRHIEIDDFLRIRLGQEMRTAIVGDPVLREYNRRPPDRLRTVADVLGHRLRWLDDLTDARIPIARLDDWPMRNSLAVQAAQATPFLWKDHVMALVHGLAMPAHVIAPDVLPFPMMWWSFESTRSLSAADEGLSALIVKHEPDAMRIVTLTLWPDGGEGSNGFALPYGTRYPSETNASGLGDAAALILAMLSFLNSPYVPKELATLDRAFRRAREHAGIGTRPEERVHFIDLRPEPHQDASDGRGHGFGVRWVVRGHHRAQWYPSLKAHKVIWIAPYIKGAPDAPLKPSIYRVSR